VGLVFNIEYTSIQVKIVFDKGKYWQHNRKTSSDMFKIAADDHPLWCRANHKVQLGHPIQEHEERKGNDDFARMEFKTFTS